jgi:hypothetical protein
MATSAAPVSYRRPQRIRWRLWCGTAAIYTVLYGVSLSFFARVGAGLNDSGEPNTLANVEYALGIATAIVALVSLLTLAGPPLAGLIGSALAGVPPLVVLFVEWENDPRTIGAAGMLLYLVIPIALCGVAASRALAAHRKGATGLAPGGA